MPSPSIAARLNRYQVNVGQLNGLNDAHSIAFRAHGLVTIVTRIVQAFARNDELQTLDVTVALGIEPVATPDGSCKGVTITHHFSLDSNIALFADEQSKRDFVGDWMPYDLMGPGTFRFAREDQDIGALLKMGDDPGLDIDMFVHRLTRRVEAAFKHTSVYHAFTVSSTPESKPAHRALPRH